MADFYDLSKQGFYRAELFLFVKTFFKFLILMLFFIK